MLLLGVVQAQVTGAPAGAGSYDLLQTEILTGSQASVTFSSLGDYATDYQHLQIRFVARSTRASSGDDLAIQFNADTGSNYAYHLLQGNGSTVGSFAETSQTEMGFMRVTSDGDTADAFGAGVIDLLDVFESSKNKTIRGLSGGVPASNPRIRLTSGLWIDTDSLTEIKCFALAGNLTAESRFSLYGLRSA